MIEVRPATVDDVPQVADLHARVAGEGLWLGTEAPVDRERFSTMFTQTIEGEDGTLIIAVDNGKVVGNLGLYPVHSGVMGLGMSIDSSYRGQGVGTALVQAAIDWARARDDVHKIELEVWPHNPAGLALYRKMGFVDEGRRLRHYRRRNGELWDVIAMGLVLDQSSPGSPHADA